MHAMSMCRALVAIVLAVLVGSSVVAADEPAAQRWIQATAYVIPKETTNQGSGYFSIVVGRNGRLYIGTAKYGVNAYLVEFDPATHTMRTVVDCQREIGTSATGFAAQSKIHTRNNVGQSGKIYFATKQGYPVKDEKRSDYPGGYPLVYDPATERTRVYPIPVPQQGIISITPDESRGVAYLSTCADSRPESSHFLILDLATGKYRDLVDSQHLYAFIVVDYRGRAYHPLQGGEIGRFDPNTDRMDRLKQTIDGAAPTAESKLALPETHPINWDISPDGKTLYAVAMSTNQLYSYDLTAEGDTLPGRSLGPLSPTADATDCRAMVVGPQGEVCMAMTGKFGKVSVLPHLVTYKPAMRRHAMMGRLPFATRTIPKWSTKRASRCRIIMACERCPTAPRRRSTSSLA